MAKNEKITKQELEEPDVFQTTLARLLDYGRSHLKQILLIASGVLIVLLLLAGWFFYEQSYRTNAQGLYARTADALMAGKFKGKEKEAIRGFQDVIQQYPRSRAAGLSHYQLGHLYYDTGDPDAAIKAFRSFTDKEKDDSDLKTLALITTGYAYELKNDLKKSLESFESALKTKMGDHFSAQIYRDMGRLHEALKDPAKALSFYQKALEKNKNPQWERILKYKIATLG